MSAAAAAKPLHVLASNPATVRSQSTQLSSSPDGSKLVYCQGRTVVIRSIDDPLSTIVYAQHSHPTTVARISPSGYYCASADQVGNVRVWDLAGGEQVLKLETKPFAGKIVDLQWDGESKRIGVVGEGRERFGHFFLMDSGSSCGEVTGHSKVVNSIAFRSQRPFRAVTAGDDCQLVFYTGVPFKYSKTISDAHNRFVHSVSYSPTGDHFISAGADGRVVLFDGSSGDKLQSVTDSAAGSDVAHKGTVFSAAFAPDGNSFVSAGADGLVKLWNIDAGKASLATTWDLNGQTEGAPTGADKAQDHQVAVTFAGKGRFVSLSLSGQLNVIDVAKGASGAVRKLHGATKAIGASAFAKAKDGSLVAGSYDGRVLRYLADGTCVPVLGPSHGTSAITGLAAAEGADSIWSIAMDDSLRRIVGDKFESSSIATAGQPRSVGTTNSGVAVVATTTGVDIVASGNRSSHALKFTPTAVGVAADGSHFAVGSEDFKVRLYALPKSGEAPSEVATLENGRSAITALAFSSDGKLLAAGESNGKILVYDVVAKSLKLNQWIYHTGRINSVAFSPDNTHAVSASLDSHVYVYSVAKPSKNIAIKNAHAGGAHGAVWLDAKTVASAGADGIIKKFTITPIA